MSERSERTSITVDVPVGAVWQPPVIRLTGVAKRWPDADGLTAVSFAVAPNELVAVEGRPGSGRSTLIALLAGWTLPDEGEIERAGDWALDEGWTTWRHTTVVPAIPMLTPDLTAGENVEAVLRTLGVDRVRWTPLMLHVMDRLDLVPVASRRPVELTPAQAQRLGVARAVVGAIAHAVPTLVVADGPTSRQECDGAALVVEALVDVAAAGSAVVVVTDDLDLAARCRTVVIDG